jgi:uncharacterized UPF0160 family protein
VKILQNKNMFSFLQRKVKVAVHDGMFHSDDVFSVAILSLYLNKPIKLFRTRDPKIFVKMDYLLDVGREYNPAENKFDHHQENWSEKRSNGIPYATSGLVWKEYGEKICGSREVAQKIDEKLIQHIDAEDNGVEFYKENFPGAFPYCFSDFIFAFNPTWTERDMNTLKAFEEAVEEVKKVLKREIKKVTDNVLGKEKIQKIYEKTEDKRILVLDDSYSWKKIVSSFPETVFVIKQVYENKNWHLNAVTEEGFKFKNKVDLPAVWAGKEGKELEEITGVSGALFCHNKRFMCAAKTKEAAVELAKLALANSKSESSKL